jgi:myo-inositol-1(or 4)-monophosphatase
VNPFLRTAIDAADAAAREHRRHAGRLRADQATEKARADYVSQADLDAQSAALAVIAARHPGHQVLAEEGEEPVEKRIARWDGGPLWIVDPLDGTANFLHGHPFYCAAVAVAVEGRPVAGAVVSGSSGERWWAAEGEGAFKGGKRIHVSGPGPLRHALLGTGFPFKRPHLLPEYLDQLDRVLRCSAGVRRAGSAALDFCFLAQGALDGFWEAFLMPWDFAAGDVIVREAGGLLTRPDGRELDIAPGPVRGANGVALLEELGVALSATP